MTACRARRPCYSGADMADMRALEALRRIERALARVESATERPASAAAPECMAELEQLRGAHERLRHRVAGAIDEVDRIIETGEQR